MVNYPRLKSWVFPAVMINMEKTKGNVKIGICFGGYNPMHQGHLDCILKAKKECDYVFVVICGYENEPRAFVDFDTRVCTIKDFIETKLNDPDNCKNVFCFGINDTELGIDESESEENWDIWLDELFRKINDILQSNSIVQVNKNRDNVTFYIGEKRYKEALDKRHIGSELVGIDANGNRINNISATEVRNNPFKYWNRITPPFRPFMTKRILITGTASEGKSTLVRDLSTYFDTTYVKEEGKRIMIERGLNDQILTYDNFREFLDKQILALDNALNNPQNKGFVFSDTDNLITLMYAKSYSTIPEFTFSEDDYIRLKEYYEKNFHNKNKWDKIFIIVPHGKFVDDGVRYMGHSSLRERFNHFSTLLDLLLEYDMIEEIELLYGNYYENFISVRDYVNNNIIQK